MGPRSSLAQSGLGDTLLVGAVTGLVISAALLMVVSFVSARAGTSSERAVLLTVGPLVGLVGAAARRRWRGRAPVGQVNP
jgi:hypothetical protein